MSEPTSTSYIVVLACVEQVRENKQDVIRERGDSQSLVHLVGSSIGHHLGHQEADQDFTQWGHEGECAWARGILPRVSPSPPPTPPPF